MSRELDFRVLFYDSPAEAEAARQQRSKNLRDLRIETHYPSGRLFLAHGRSGPSPSMQPKVFCRDRRWRGWSWCKFSEDEAA